MKAKILKVLLISAVLALFICAVPVFAAESTSAEQDTSSDLNIAYCNLSFESDVHILYAVKSADADIKLLVWSDVQDEYVVDTQDSVLSPLSEKALIDGEEYTVFKYKGLAAKQMTDDVYVRTYITDADGNAVYGDLHKYSILQYARNTLAKETSSENLKNALTAMLDYGAAMQILFDYKTDSLANASFSQVNLTEGTLPDGFKQGLFAVGEKVILNAPYLNSENVSFSHWVDENGEKLSGTSEISNNTVSFELTVAEGVKTYTPVYTILHITNADELKSFRDNAGARANYADWEIYLDGNIDLEGEAWTPVASFAGTFDGQGYTVSNLTANLFGTVSGTVKNLNVENVNILNTSKNGANGFIETLATGGLVDNCKVSDVTIAWTAGKGTTDCWGGIISRVNAGAAVQNCEFTNITVTADKYVKRSSAVFAEVTGKISNCIIDGVTLTVADNYSGEAYTSQVGGIIADLYDGGEVSDCEFNNVTVVIDEGFNTGGVIGKVGVGGNTVGNTLKNIEVNNLKLTAGNTIVSYAAFSNIGGFIGQVDYRSATALLTMDNCHINGLDMTVASIKVKEDPSAGFIASLNGNAVITNCSVDGKIDGTNEPLGIGGFLGTVGGYSAPAAGYTVNISDCVADVTITGNDNIFVGGFIAYAGSYNQKMNLSMSFTNCEATGSFYGRIEAAANDNGTAETVTFTDCKVDGKTLIVVRTVEE